MKYRVYIVPHTHFDAEVFMNRNDTLELGFSILQTAMYLFKTDPDFTFSLDQTCYVEPYLRRHPEEKPFLLEMVTSGRLEITGGMHVMPDLNIPAGESFIRQVLHGRRYFENELGVDVKAGWTLDSFGHHPQVPQLMAKGGFDYTIFQRLMKKDGPSEFLYRGLDGTELPCAWTPASYAVLHNPPGNLYEFKKTIEPRLRHLKAHAQTGNILALNGADLSPPDPHLLSMVKEYNACQNEYELVFTSSKEFFSAIDWSDGIPVIEDDLNPVFQGCYSARIEIKQKNRELETLLLDWEKADAMGKLADIPFRNDRRDDAWEKVLFNQFHDIICGSHIDKVFYAAMARYEQAKVEAEQHIELKFRDIASQMDTAGEGIPIVVFNTLGWERCDVVECSVVFSDPDVYDLEVRDSSGTLVPSDLVRPERFPTGGIKKTGVLFIGKNIPAFGYEVYRILPSSGTPVETELKTSHPLNLREDKAEGFLENEFCRIHFNLWNGLMDGFYDKKNRWEILPEDSMYGNTVVKEQDFGNFWQYNGPCKGDAFHPFTDTYPLPHPNAAGVDFSHRYLGDANITTGKAYVEFNIDHPFGSGHFSTRVRLYPGVERVDVRTTLRNEDERVRYRAVLPTSIRNGTITHEIPFGAIDRPEGEFPAQNWIDYSDGEKGIALLNRGLPGNNVVDNVMLLSLLKCTALKEGYAEIGGFKLGVPTDRGYEKGIEHIFEYAFLPHAGDWRSGACCRRAMEYNTPLIALNTLKQKGRLPARKSFVQCPDKNIVLSCFKPGEGAPEDGAKLEQKALTLRVYECEGKPAEHASLRFNFNVNRIEETNLAEKKQNDIVFDSSKGDIELSIGAFEIKTFKLFVD